MCTHLVFLVIFHHQNDHNHGHHNHGHHHCDKHILTYGHQDCLSDGDANREKRKPTLQHSSKCCTCSTQMQNIMWDNVSPNNTVHSRTYNVIQSLSRLQFHQTTCPLSTHRGNPVLAIGKIWRSLQSMACSALISHQNQFRFWYQGCKKYPVHYNTPIIGFK